MHTYRSKAAQPVISRPYNTGQLVYLSFMSKHFTHATSRYTSGNDVPQCYLLHQCCSIDVVPVAKLCTAHWLACSWLQLPEDPFGAGVHETSTSAARPTGQTASAAATGAGAGAVNPSTVSSSTPETPVFRSGHHPACPGSICGTCGGMQNTCMRVSQI